MEGLDGERPLQTGEVVIIVVVLLMWAGEYRMGSRGLGSMIVGSGEGYGPQGFQDFLEVVWLLQPQGCEWRGQDQGSDGIVVFQL